MRKKFLLIRFSSIGDIVLTTPVIRCMKQQLQGAEIHYLTKETYRPLLDSNPHIDKLITIRQDIGEVKQLLKKEKYDRIIDLHHNLRSLRVKGLLGVKSTTLNKLNIEKWLLVNLRINKLPKKHIVDRYMDTVTDLGVKYDGQGLDYFIPEKDHVLLNSLPLQFQNSYIAFVIGAKFATKRLPVEKIISICKKMDQPVLLFGGPEDKDRGEAIASSDPEKILNTCGRYNINQSASLVKQAKKVITHDTGLMHIAAALDKEIISVWGNTVPDFGMYPFMKNGAGNKVAVVEVQGLNCRPCSKLGHAKCPRGHFKCMRLIDEDEIKVMASN